MTSFEDAARRMLGAPPDAEVYSEMGDDGDDGCGTCGYGRSESYIRVYAYHRARYENGRLKKQSPQHWEATFTDLPALWTALFPDEDIP